jgi:flagellar operon protein
MADIVVNGVTVPFVPIGGVGGIKDRARVDLPRERSFDAVLEGECNRLKFSKHAQQRLESRNIQLDDADLSSLEHAVSMAQEKGAKDALVMLRNLALIINVPNKTVITALDQQSTGGNVFTNIDSAVIVQ